MLYVRSKSIFETEWKGVEQKVLHQPLDEDLEDEDLEEEDYALAEAPVEPL